MVVHYWFDIPSSYMCFSSVSLLQRVSRGKWPHLLLVFFGRIFVCRRVTTDLADRTTGECSDTTVALHRAQQVSARLPSHSLPLVHFPSRLRPPHSASASSCPRRGRRCHHHSSSPAVLCLRFFPHFHLNSWGARGAWKRTHKAPSRAFDALAAPPATCAIFILTECALITHWNKHFRNCAMRTNIGT